MIADRPHGRDDTTRIIMTTARTPLNPKPRTTTQVKYDFRCDIWTGMLILGLGLGLGLRILWPWS